MDVRFPEHLITFFANSIQSSELGLVIDSHTTQAGEAPLVQVDHCTRLMVFLTQDHQKDQCHNGCCRTNIGTSFHFLSAFRLFALATDYLLSECDFDLW